MGGCRKLSVQSLAPQKLGIMAYTCHSNTRMVSAIVTEGQGHPQLRVTPSQEEKKKNPTEKIHTHTKKIHIPRLFFPKSEICHSSDRM